ncbi:dipeptide epimerase [Brevibacillus composti]|uniref:Dipeptide epimerase n=1 Tax=Brevibacillus composti TaxID=2796470 RepID=A0A7T5EMN0_9BACL|nr:dipeptide epimerase [Brevibacillus composti]QQE75395.1 dipeptide epimerase [Brevibacillus composti]QUO42421.1 dipeptide epimerase [Brevibacillus composti]
MARIRSVDIYAIALPLIRPFIISYDSFHEMPTILVRLETEEGIVGYGEATPDEHVTGETYWSTIEVLKHHLGPAVLGEHPFALERIHAKMNQKVKGVPAAKAAIDIACHDLMGKLAGQPLYRLLGGPAHEELVIPYVMSILPPDVMAEEAKAAVADGYRTLKLKVGTDVPTDVARVRAVRQAVGPDIRLRVDVNQGWGYAAETLGALGQLADCHIDWIEQPVHADDLDGMADIRRQTAIPVMVDEGLLGDKEMRQIIQKNAADWINIKLMKCGGLYPAVRLIHQAEMAGIRTQIGSMVESAVATAAGAHLSLAKKNVWSNEMVGPRMFADDVADFPIAGDRIRLSESPGLGIDVQEEKIASLARIHIKLT